MKEFIEAIKSGDLVEAKLYASKVKPTMTTTMTMTTTKAAMIKATTKTKSRLIKKTTIKTNKRCK